MTLIDRTDAQGKKEKSPIPVKAAAPVAVGAAAGLGAGALLMAVLQNYPEVIPQILGWGPGIIILAGVAWMVNKFAPPLVAAQHATATALQKLADTVATAGAGQQDLVLATQVNSDKIDRMSATLDTIKEAMERRRSTDA